MVILILKENNNVLKLYTRQIKCRFLFSFSMPLSHSIQSVYFITIPNEIYEVRDSPELLHYLTGIWTRFLFAA